MGKPRSPRPADPRITAGAQTSTNIGTAIAQQNLNNINQITPYGNLSYEQTGSYTYTDPNSGDQHEIPTFTATQTLSPDQRAVLDQNNRSSLNLATLGANQSARLNGLLGRPLDTSGLPGRGDVNSIRQTNLQRVGHGPSLQTELGNTGAVTRTYGTDFSDDRQRVEDALMDRMNPRLEQDRMRMESRLASQGIRVGSEAYNAAMDDYSRQTNDARLSAILGAGQEQSRLAGLEAARAGFENAAQAQAFQQDAARNSFRNDSLQQMHQNRLQSISMDNQAAVQETNADMARFDATNNAHNQALQEQLTIRNQPINEITSLMSGSQVQNPNFITPNTAQLANTDFAGIQANYDNAMQQRYQQQMSARNNLFGGILGFGANLLAPGAGSILSDRRVKTDIKKVGKTNDGQNIYQYRYKSGGPIQMGLMAQEVERKKPEAVSEVDGVKSVNYGIALGGSK